jgi:hypothetical protein
MDFERPPGTHEVSNVSALVHSPHKSVSFIYLVYLPYNPWSQCTPVYVPFTTYVFPIMRTIYHISQCSFVCLPYNP